MITTTKKKTYDLRGLRVLVLEEFQFMANLMSSILRDFHVGSVVATCKVSEAMKKLEEHNLRADLDDRIDLIITDLLPPNNEGLSFLAWVRKHPEKDISYVPVLFCSTHTSMSVVIAGRDTGAEEIMVKPMTAEKIAQRLSYIIDLPRPYIKAPGFFGPDRRRQKKAFSGEDKRAKNNDNLRITYETDE